VCGYDSYAACTFGRCCYGMPVTWHACLHVLSACAGARNPVSALNSNAGSLPPLQCDHFVTGACNQDRHKESEYEDILLS
jgi:hypothetical protein